MIRIFNLVALLVFLLSAIVQYNDPDPILWIFIYSLAAFSCFLFAREKPARFSSGSTFAASILWISSLSKELYETDIPIEWGSVFMQTSMKTISVELAREIGGLCIVSFWMLIISIKTKR